MSKKISIVHIVGGLHSGGVEAVIYNYFSHIDMNKFDVHIISNSPSVPECEKQFRELGFNIHVLPERRKNFFSNLKQTIKIFKTYKFDILHSHMNLNSFYHTFLGMICGIQIRIAHSHLVEFPSGIVSKSIAGIKKFLNKLFTTHYFACGETAGAYMFGKRNLEKGKIHIIKNAINVDKFLYNENTRNEIRSSLGINNRFCIGHVGRFTEQKNHLQLVDIFAKYKQLNPDSVLLLIGTGELETQIKELVKTLKLENDVKFLGVCTDVEKYYQAMDAFLFPSNYEGLGIVLVEAQAASLKCFSSDVVPKEAKVTDLVTFIPLKKSSDEWAKIIFASKNNTRINMKKEITDAGYEIISSTHKLENLYQKLLKRGKS